MENTPQSEVDYQMSHKDEYSASGLPAFIIAGMIISVCAVALRLWSRKIADIPWKSDDYTLIVGLILTCAAQSCNLNMVLNGGFGRHTLTLSDSTWEIYGKSSYAWDVLYTVAYPVSRISLVLLYRRVFIQNWFRMLCWFLIFCYAGYALSTAIVDLCQSFPIESNWNQKVPPTRHIDDQKLYIANSGFNIATDAILLVMPLAVVWSMNMTRAHKAGLSAIFCLGALTVVASILRLVYYYQFDTNDPLFSLYKANWWTVAETYLGIICPCLVTFRPLIRSGYLIFSSHLSPHTRARIDRLTGSNMLYANGHDSENGKPDLGGNASSSSDIHARDDHSPAKRPRPQSQLENGIAMDDLASSPDVKVHGPS